MKKNLDSLYTEHIVSKYLTRMRTGLNKADAVKRGIWYNPTQAQRDEIAIRRMAFETRRRGLMMKRIQISVRNAGQLIISRLMEQHLGEIADHIGVPRSKLMKPIKFTIRPVHGVSAVDPRR